MMVSKLHHWSPLEKGQQVHKIPHDMVIENTTKGTTLYSTEETKAKGIRKGVYMHVCVCIHIYTYIYLSISDRN